jgi:hypothetical protein
MYCLCVNVLLPPGNNPIAVIKYIIPYHKLAWTMLSWRYETKGVGCLGDTHCKKKTLVPISVKISPLAQTLQQTDARRHYSNLVRLICSYRGKRWESKADSTPVAVMHPVEPSSITSMKCGYTSKKKKGAPFSSDTSANEWPQLPNFSANEDFLTVFRTRLTNIDSANERFSGCAR